jgi:hypothetical protein
MMQWPPANEGNFFVCLFAPRKAGQLKIHRFYLFSGKEQKSRGETGSSVTRFRHLGGIF